MSTSLFSKELSRRGLRERGANFLRVVWRRFLEALLMPWAIEATDRCAIWSPKRPRVLNDSSPI